MGKVGKQALLHTVPHLSAVDFQNLRIICRVTGVLSADLIFQVVLTQQHIFDAVILQKRQQPGKQCRVILHLYANRQFDFSLIYFLQLFDSIHILRKLLGLHTKPGIIISIKQIGRMVRKAQHFDPAGKSIFDIFYFCTLGMIAAGSMRMIICAHNRALHLLNLLSFRFFQ